MAKMAKQTLVIRLTWNKRTAKKHAATNPITASTRIQNPMFITSNRKLKNRYLAVFNFSK